MKAELVPTLQERITQKTREDDLIAKFRDNWNWKDMLLRSGRLSPMKVRRMMAHGPE